MGGYAVIGVPGSIPSLFGGFEAQPNDAIQPDGRGGFVDRRSGARYAPGRLVAIAFPIGGNRYGDLARSGVTIIPETGKLRHDTLSGAIQEGLAILAAGFGVGVAIGKSGGTVVDPNTASSGFDWTGFLATLNADAMGWYHTLSQPTSPPSGSPGIGPTTGGGIAISPILVIAIVAVAFVALRK